MVASTSPDVFWIDSKLRLTKLLTLSGIADATSRHWDPIVYRDSAVRALRAKLTDSVSGVSVGLTLVTQQLDSLLRHAPNPIFAMAFVSGRGRLTTRVHGDAKGLWREYDLATGRQIRFIQIPHRGVVKAITGKGDRIAAIESIGANRDVIVQYRLDSTS